ncbi:MAG: metal ABC transporter ATP-binding protein [Thermoplasmata archaeon]
MRSKAQRKDDEMSSAAILTDSLSYRYKPKDREAIQEVSIDVGKGEVFAIMGPNGSGKTTLMKVLMGLLIPQGGSARVLGIDPVRHPIAVQRLIGYVPQKEHISSNLPIKVGDVVLMGRLARKGLFRSVDRKDIRAAIQSLKDVGLSHLWNKPFSSLSGGQQQRVLFARALAVEPRILMLDEPFSGMDVPSQGDVVEVIGDLAKRSKVTTAIILHDINNLIHITDKVLLLNRKVVGFGDPYEVLSRENLISTYGSTVRIVVCEEGYCHPLIGDAHG